MVKQSNLAVKSSSEHCKVSVEDMLTRVCHKISCSDLMEE